MIFSVANTSARQHAVCALIHSIYKFKVVGTVENLGLGGLIKLPGEHFEAKFKCLFTHDVSQSFIFSDSLSEGTFGLFLGRNGTKKDLVYTIGLSIYIDYI